jgi:hypothetical protein
LQPSDRLDYNLNRLGLDGARCSSPLLSLLSLLSLLLSSGCGPRPLTPPPTATVAPADDLPRAPLTLQATPPDLMVWVDGTPRGSLSKLPQQTLLLPLGRRRLELRGDGYYPHRADVTLHPDQPLTLQITLTPRLD